MSKILDTKPVMYRLHDMKEEEILGGFYERELKKAKTSGLYQIEKIIKSQTCTGVRQLFVLWLGYNSDFDTWIAALDVHNA